ncbi:MAG: ATP-dependent RecD-like DNA helicase [Proteobacteria bacterium]|nr:ATP-dependent RecD-like DNA helicase [Pseudomonadota bacterium]
MSSVTGLIERVTFHNEETGFCVVRVKVDGHRDLVTVVGRASSINAGEWLTAEGAWIQDRDHGTQLKAELLQTSAPTSREGIEKYLASGLIKGIGPVYAKKLVEKFGEGVFDVIDRESVRLEQVRGIGAERRRTIRTAWAEQKIVREIMVFLHSNGVSTSRAVRIYKTYGDEAVEKVRANPYLLARDISGIGFKTADDIARKLGIPEDSILRARAGLSHALSEAGGNGHCALPKEVLLKNAADLLAMDFLILQRALSEMLAESELEEDGITGEDLIFLPPIRRAEVEVASRLARLAEARAEYPEIDADKAIAWLKEKKSIDLAPSQAEALRRALVSRVSVITGGPGVGKTTLVNSILTLLRAKQVKCLLCAPTGRAAKRLSETTGLEAKTIHRLLEFQNAGFSRNPSNPLDCDLLVADETSMMDVQLMSKLLQALPARAHLILVGDVDQLPSVGPGAVLGDIIRSGTVPVVRLTEIFRQASSSRIIVNAHRINSGAMPESEKDADFFFIEREEPESVPSTILELVAERIPKKWKLDPRRDIQVLCPMNRGSLGTAQMNRLLQERLNPKRNGDPSVEKFGWEFRVRDKVIQTRNNYDKEVFNGDIGEIFKIDDFEREVVIAFDGREVVYDFNELDEVSLAYAITIHKSQGSEFPVVVMPLAMQQYLLLQRNLVYTGITRGRRLVVLVGQKKALQTAVRNVSAVRRYTALEKRLGRPQF